MVKWTSRWELKWFTCEDALRELFVLDWESHRNAWHSTRFVSPVTVSEALSSVAQQLPSPLLRCRYRFWRAADMPSVQLNTDLINARIKHIIDAWNVRLLNSCVIFTGFWLDIFRAQAEMMNMNRYPTLMEFSSLQVIQAIQRTP